MGMMKRFVDKVYDVLQEDFPEYREMDYAESADLGIEIAQDLFSLQIYADHPAFRDKILQLAKERGLHVPDLPEDDWREAR